jgi:hypothetical protein|tara:strand:- start:5423 stop:5680 length:258 start_codon:yes stop_codon:yes gene_type:complete
MRLFALCRGGLDIFTLRRKAVPDRCILIVEGGRFRSPAGDVPVRFTMSPSLIVVSLPKQTIPTLSFSRFSAMPFTPDANSTISPD